MNAVHTFPKHCGASASPHLSTSPANLPNQSICVSDSHVIGTPDASHSQGRNHAGPGFGRARVVRAGAAPRQPRRYARWRSAAKRTHSARPHQTNPTLLEIPGVRSHAVAERITRSGRSPSAEKYKTNPIWRRNRQTIDSGRRRANLHADARRTRSAQHCQTKPTEQPERVRGGIQNKANVASKPDKPFIPGRRAGIRSHDRARRNLHDRRLRRCLAIRKNEPTVETSQTKQRPFCPPAEHFRNQPTKARIASAEEYKTNPMWQWPAFLGSCLTPGALSE